MKLFFEYRYMVYDIVKKFDSEKYDIEKLTDVGICTLLRLSQEYNSDSGTDFKSLTIFSIKSELNKYISENY